MKSNRKKDLIGYAFIAPWLLGFVLFTAWPFFRSVYLSFTRFDVVAAPQWVGAANYRVLLTQDEIFWTAASVTLRYAAIAVPLSIVAGVSLALPLNANVRRISI